LRQEFCVDTADQDLHLEAYLCSDRDAPLLLLTHGEGGYAGMFVRLALALHDCGVSTLVLEQRGHGQSSGREKDFTLGQLAQDVLDAAHWVRRHFQGPLFLGGTNQGSGLVYQASAHGAPVIGLVCHGLYDFSRPQDALAVSRFAGLANMPGGFHVASAAVRTLMALAPARRVAYDSLLAFDGLLDERDNGNFEAWLEDPNPVRQVSLRYAASLFSTPLAMPYEQNALPVLVFNPQRDRMIDPQLTLRNYRRLGGPKTCTDLDYGHWSMTEGFSRTWAEIASGWMQNILSAPEEL
jgi:alpha-beta hydrolase superfamily lysophospholipase